MTYYGPVKNTRFGQLLFDTDSLISVFRSSVDHRTGKPLPLYKMPGFRSKLEIDARAEHAEAEEARKKKEAR